MVDSMEAFGGEPPEILEEVFKPEVPTFFFHPHHNRQNHYTFGKVVAYQENAPVRGRYNGYRRFSFPDLQFNWRFSFQML